MHRQTGPANPERVAIILAGGEGVRLRTLTTKITGGPVPKQFCSLLGDASLLEQTRRRVALAFREDRILTVLNRGHERFYRSQLADVPDAQLVVQPQGRGTAAAIAYALFRGLRFGRDAVVAVFPSDHYVDQDHAFMRYVDLALGAVDARPELTVLLGIPVERPEPNYGWIEPSQRIPISGVEVFAVRRFWEKPSHETVEKLVAAGALCNTLVMVARISTLLGQLLAAKPGLYASFALVKKTMGTAMEQDQVHNLYARLETVDFSSAVLTASAASLAVLPVAGVRWSDLGEPLRVMETIARMGSAAPRWAAA